MNNRLSIEQDSPAPDSEVSPPVNIRLPGLSGGEIGPLHEHIWSFADAAVTALAEQFGLPRCQVARELARVLHPHIEGEAD